MQTRLKLALTPNHVILKPANLELMIITKTFSSFSYGFARLKGNAKTLSLETPQTLKPMVGFGEILHHLGPR